MTRAAPRRPLAEEATLLVAALRDLLTGSATYGGHSHGHDDGHDGHDPAGTGATARGGSLPDPTCGTWPVGEPMTTCQICPVCRLVAALAAGRPDVAAHLFTAVTALTAALRASLAGQTAANKDGPATAGTGGTGGTCGSGTQEHTTAGPAPRSRIQRIDVQ